MSSISRILVTTDFSEISKDAFSLAVEMAKVFRAKITILHVFEEDLVAVYPMIAGYMQPEVIEAGRYREEARKRSEEALQALAKDLAKKGVAVDTMLRAGTKPFIEIVRAAREIPADLVVMATHGRTGLKYVLIGSTAERVVRKAPCAVLTVKPPGPEFTAP